VTKECYTQRDLLFTLELFLNLLNLTNLDTFFLNNIILSQSLIKYIFWFFSGSTMIKRVRYDKYALLQHSFSIKLKMLVI